MMVPERAGIGRVGERRRVQGREIVPENHVADFIEVVEPIFVPERVRLQLIE